MRSRKFVAPKVARKVWLVGESNPYGSPAYALWYEPPGCSGDRLRRILGHSPEEYVETYERRNLLQLRMNESWPAERAAKAASELRGEPGEDDAVVLCGAKVAAAFGLRYDRAVLPELVYIPRPPIDRMLPALVIPHPSGLNRMWGEDKTLESRVREAVANLRAGRSGR